MVSTQHQQHQKAWHAIQHEYIYCKSNGRRPMAGKKLLWILMANKGFVKCEWLSLPLALPFHGAHLLWLAFRSCHWRGWYDVRVCLCDERTPSDARFQFLYVRIWRWRPTQKTKSANGHHKIFTHQITNHKNGIFITASTTASATAVAASGVATICHLQYLLSTRSW